GWIHFGSSAEITPPMPSQRTNRPTGYGTTSSVTANNRDISPRQQLQVARVATETARKAAAGFNCDGKLGERLPALDRSESEERSPAKATGTCKGVFSASQVRSLRITAVSEMPAGALAEECTAWIGKPGHYRLGADPLK
ncbi:hypothetical protein ACIO9J_44485, partial [Streptomyces sp. NPDC087300]